MKEAILKRNKELDIKIIYLVDELPNKTSGWAFSKQIVRSGTSVEANYRAVCLAKSTADFIHKLKIVEEECDETVFWLEVIEEAGMLSKDRIRNLKSEAIELLTIFVSSLRKAKINSLAKLETQHPNCQSSIVKSNL